MHYVYRQGGIMVEILIQGGDTETAAREMRAAIKEIFEVDPLETRRGDGQQPGTRFLAELAIALAITPAIESSIRLFSQSGLHSRLARLLKKADEQAKKTGARFLIDTGAGKPIPANEANL